MFCNVLLCEDNKKLNQSNRLIFQMHFNILSCLVGLSLSTFAAAQRSFTVPVNYDNEITVSYYFRENNDLVSVSATDEGLQVSVNANDADICNILSSGMVIYAPGGQENTLLSWNQYNVFHLVGPDGQPLQWSSTNAQNCPFGSSQASSSASSSAPSTWSSPSSSSVFSGSSATVSPSSLFVSSSSSAPSSSSSAIPSSSASSSSSVPSSSSAPSPSGSSSSAPSSSSVASPSSSSSDSSSSTPIPGSTTSSSPSSTITSAPGSSNGGSSPTFTRDGVHTIASEYTVTSDGQVYIYTKWYVVSASLGPSTTSVSTLRPLNPTLDIAALTAAGNKRHQTHAPATAVVKRAEGNMPAQGAGARSFPSSVLLSLAVLMGLSICVF
ncbi:hypothetical protein ZYGR_0W00680 [Zygosaccharomyces rouxii]|uniref:Uncharacterized protein n=1 Tax=Zygosaccharomyces rouxii TaxID=4956 RepID=A0A1Q3A4B1_ZYGRO|nr:hypothetical protein ZYGR_0W00680 [Zygosaccharomyces rouxii]